VRSPWDSRWVGRPPRRSEVADPTGDDKGPGTYTYPTDAVYTPGSFDLVAFEVGDGDNPDFKSP